MKHPKVARGEVLAPAQTGRLVIGWFGRLFASGANHKRKLVAGVGLAVGAKVLVDASRDPKTDPPHEITRPRTCKQKYPNLPNCSEMYYHPPFRFETRLEAYLDLAFNVGIAHASPDDAEYHQPDHNDHIRPCTILGTTGQHWDVYHPAKTLSWGNDSYMGSITCCRCCEIDGIGVSERCNSKDVYNHPRKK